MGASGNRTPTTELQLPGPWAVAHLARPARGGLVSGVDSALDSRHEGGGGHGESADGGKPGEDRDAAGLPAPRGDGGPHPPAVALRVGAAGTGRRPVV